MMTSKHTDVFGKYLIEKFILANDYRSCQIYYLLAIVDNC